MIKGYFLVWVTTRAAIEKNKDISLEDWQCGFPLKLKDKYYHFTSIYHLRWSTIAFDCESANFDAINCERRQSMQLNRECVASNYDVFWFLFYFVIRIPDCLVRYCVTTQYPVYEKVISDWSPWHWNHGRSCFVGSVDIFRWPTRSCKEIHLVSWMTSYPTRNLPHWSVKLWVNKLTLTSCNQNNRGLLTRFCASLLWEMCFWLIQLYSVMLFWPHLFEEWIELSSI